MFATAVDNPIFIYEFENGIKMYRPLCREKSNKWRQNISDTTIQGYAQLPEKDSILIITKSLKDVMCLDEMGYCSIAPLSETTYLPETVITELKNRFKKIYVIMDNDKTGQKAAMHYFNTYQIPYLFIEKEKDVSDYIKKFGMTDLKKFFKILIV